MKQLMTTFKNLGDYVSPPQIVIDDRHYFIPMGAELLLLVFAIIGKFLVGPFEDDYFNYFILVMLVTIAITAFVWFLFNRGLKNVFTKLFALVILFVSQVEFMEFFIQLLSDKSKVYFVWLIMPIFYIVNTGYRLMITRISVGKSRKIVLNRLYYFDGLMYGFAFLLAFLDTVLGYDYLIYAIIVWVVAFWEFFYQGYIGALRKDFSESREKNTKRYDSVIGLLKENKEKEEDNESN